MMPTPATSRIDVREIAPPLRHGLIFQQFGALAPEQWLELVADHDPQPLHRQFEAMHTGEFEWAYLERGPERWRVQIRRLAPVMAAGAGDCCSGGACG